MVDSKTESKTDPNSGDEKEVPVKAVEPVKEEASDVSKSPQLNEGEKEPEPKGGLDVPAKRNIAPLGSLCRFADPCDTFMIFVSVLGAIVVGGVMPAFSLLLGNLLNDINHPDPDVAAGGVEEIALIFLWVGIGMLFAGFFRNFGFQTAAARIQHRFRLRYFQEMLRQDVAWHDQVEGKEFTSKLADASEKLASAVGIKFADAITYLSTFVVGLAVGFSVNWKLTLVIIAFLPIIVGLGAALGRLMSTAASAGAAAYAAAGGVAEEAVGSIRTITALNAQSDTFKLYSQYLSAAEYQSSKSSMQNGLVFGLFFMCMFSAYCLAFWYGATLLVSDTDDIEGGDIITVFFCVLFGAMNLGQAGPAMTAVQDAQAVMYEAFQVIDREPEGDIQSTAGVMVEKDSCKGHIELRDVHFRYPTRPDNKVLKGVSFSVEPGTSVALVGGSGCGKSTCMALIQRFYTPDEGSVLLDGVDMQDVNLASMRSVIGIVSQEPTLFATDIMTNIKLGAGSDRVPTDEEVYEAAKQANIHDFIKSLPDGYNTTVGDQGIQLSGGQKQRIAIARALLRNPTVLLLDEATSALDTQSERVVQGALDNLMAERTTIMIAHRLSTVRKATNIIVMKEGNIIEQGSHDELADKAGGVYAKLAQLQALAESDGRESTRHEEGNVDEIITPDPTMDPTARSSSARASGAKLSKDELKELAAAKREEKKAKAKAAAEHQRRLMKMSFSNGREVCLLLVALLMACINGAVNPSFSILFTEILDVFFMCQPIDFPRVNLTEVPPAPYNDTRYNCVPEDLTEFFGNATEVVSNATRYEEIIDGCEFDDLDVCETALVERATQFALYFLIIAAAAGTSMFFRAWLFGMSGASLTRRLREASFASILKQDIGFFDDDAHSTGALTTRLATDAAVVQAAVGDNLGTMVGNVCTIIVALIIGFIAGWELTLLMLGLLPLVVVGHMIQARTRFGSSKVKESETSNEARAGQIVSESVRGVRTVAAFGIQKNVQGLYDDLMRGSYTGAFGVGACAGITYGYSQFILFAIYTAAFYFAAYLLRIDLYTADQVMRVFFAMFLSAIAIGNAAAQNSDLARGQKAIPHIFDLIDHPTKCDPTDPKGLVIAPPLGKAVQGRIEFKNVSFTYPTRRGKVLKGISFVVEPGQTVALVGGSGSGKSTIFGLLQRFYNLHHTDKDGNEDGCGDGEITLDGRPITDYNLATLRRILGVVEQEPRLFSTTLQKNIVFGLEPTPLEETFATVQGTGGRATGVEVPDAEASPKVDAENVDLEMPKVDAVLKRRIDDALAASSASEFVSSLPQGLNTAVGEAGKSQMSGGQKQRIAIARALLRDAPIMLLDEATSALDSESEKFVQHALNQIMAERTTLVIAHRLSTIQDADQIIVMDKGNIVERGTHQELLALEGKYADLCREQSMATA